MGFQNREWISCSGSQAALALRAAGKRFVAFDFETTGLDSEADRVTEFGAVRFGPEGEEEEFSALADPGIPISEDAAKVSGITNEMVAGLRPVGEVMREFFAFLGNDPLVAHNTPFDASFMYAEADRQGIPRPTNELFDSRLLAKEAFPHEEKYSLQILAARFNLDPGSAHRALDDAYTCMRLFELCLKELQTVKD
jgi:DNA polymerase III epsilon subunit family exonuclease